MMLAVVDARTFGINLFIIIGAVVLLSLAFVLVLLVWTGVRAGIWRRRQVRAEREQRLGKLDGSGQRRPPADRGLCDRCGRLFDEVYHLPDGSRRCPRCYALTVEESP